MANPELDTYSRIAENTDIGPQQKITDLQGVVKEAKTGMLTSRDVDGNLHSRAMIPCAPTSENQVTLLFIANNASHKFPEIQNDSHVNVSFCDPSSTDWASFSGKARLSQDRDLVKKHWSSMLTAYFGDLKDGVHTGDSNDPRVSIIEVIPDEIRYWVANSSSVLRTAQVAASAAVGKATSPGQLRTITKEEIQLVSGLQK
ncbi:hypothetical protein CONPUDRAFT_152115 [Coniophora puteana RWD-64-598 SS2]|uniref:General stress protein FMN-binding split barrel domain-containing protein n=1 Tax=Coniophora puteana (strain RWD-64-598) TaxID=741705 RepID=A0A5M3MV72_CONPW|nr:uncharacterized protein CONPUDRAFT_152115 [Coniophora puteana RWD-64-598 SS2]EIW83072.1 hypothetical protein CONPUDRAFT_152115 [Coniophora puteana RWD-64-598 SS2]